MIKKKRCLNMQCSSNFYGGSSSKFCSNACRLKNWRADNTSERTTKLYLIRSHCCKYVKIVKGSDPSKVREGTHFGVSLIDSVECGTVGKASWCEQLFKSSFVEISFKDIPTCTGWLVSESAIFLLFESLKNRP